ncbi:chorismate mutase [uncultured Selenomonas sp.]|uniref:chorismate mutase n=1 Tax=uncultured Selenomonas sp. TaxID=159275 RepID=UPI0025FDCF96|nr:chorismate mutase [uncultured Selenomonas sp.]
MRGIRGAITVTEDTKEAIWQAAAEMVQAAIERNDVQPEDIGAAIFSQTEDLTSAFPSAGVRRLVKGFDLVPLFDARQLAIDGSLPRCIRVLLLVDTAKAQRDIQHIYLDGARALRPDIAK